MAPMIIKCPKCNKVLSVKAGPGTLVLCPFCRHKMRVPAGQSGTAGKAQSSPKSAAKPSQAGQDDFTPYALQQSPEPPGAPKKRASDKAAEAAPDEDLTDEEFGMDREYVRRRRMKAKQKASQEAKRLWIRIGVIVGLQVLLGILGVLHPLFQLASLAVSLIVANIGFIWYLVVVGREEGAQQVLLNLFVPFYEVYYLITRWHLVWQPFVFAMAGAVPLCCQCIAGLVVYGGVLAFLFFLRGAP